MRGSTACQRVVAALLRGMARNSKETATGRYHCAIGRQTDAKERQTDAMGRQTLTLCEGRPALRDAIRRHGAQWDGRATLWDGRPTLWDGISVSLSPESEGQTPISVSLPPASVGLPPSNVLVSRLHNVCMPCMWDCNDKSGR